MSKHIEETIHGDKQDSTPEGLDVVAYSEGDPITFLDESGKPLAYGVVTDGEPEVDLWWGNSWCIVPDAWQKDEYWIAAQVIRMYYKHNTPSTLASCHALVSLL